LKFFHLEQLLAQTLYHHCLMLVLYPYLSHGQWY
jgi:hypothetical protein